MKNTIDDDEDLDGPGPEDGPARSPVQTPRLKPGAMLWGASRRAKHVMHAERMLWADAAKHGTPLRFNLKSQAYFDF